MIWASPLNSFSPSITKYKIYLIQFNQGLFQSVQKIYDLFNPPFLTFTVDQTSDGVYLRFVL